MYFLIINLGLKSIRAIVFDSAGHKIVQAFLPINTIIKGDRVEQDPSEWWTKAVEVTRKACLDETLRKKIKYMTVTSSAGCLVTLDGRNEPVYNVLMVSDKRARKESKQIEGMAEFQQLRERFEYEIAPYYMLPKLLWFKNNEGKDFNRIRKTSTANGFLLQKIIDRNIIDLFDAEKFYYNQLSGYPTELIARLGLSGIEFPEVKKYGKRIGRISKKAGEALGLNDKIEVILSSYDAICAFYGCGATESGECCDVSGTVTSIRVMADSINLKRKKKGIFVQSIDGHYIVGGSNNLGGGVIEWLRQSFYATESHPYEVLEKEGKGGEVGAKGLIFLPYLMGERAPIWNDDAKGVFFGIERNHIRSDFTRAVLEGIGFSIRSIIDIIKESGVSVRKIRVSGGLAQIHTINMIKADILNQEVMVLEEFETTSLGALMMMTISAGIYKDFKEAASNIVRIREAIYPNRENHAKYQIIYELYRDLYQATIPIYKKRAQVYSALYQNLAEEIANL